MKRLFYWLSIFILSLYSLPLWADDLYQVNVIIFKSLNDSNLSGENWTAQLRKPNLKNVVELTSVKKIQPASLTIDTNKIKSSTDLIAFEKKLQKLNESSQYEILLADSWTQFITAPSTAQWNRLQGEKNYAINGTLFQELDGKIKLSQTNKKELFNLNLQLYLTESSSWMSSFPVTPSGYNTFTLFEDRRIALNQVNYLDHPLLGMLIGIHKVQ